MDFSFLKVRYRILYFWHREGTVVISHGFVKKTAEVPQREIQRARNRKRLLEQNPDLHIQEIHNAR